LTDLLNQCVSLEPAFFQFQTECITVDQYYIPTRYPAGTPGGGPLTTPSKVEAKEALTAAETILQFVAAQLS
jgi:HEPN domain-containing protein